LSPCKGKSFKRIRQFTKLLPLQGDELIATYTQGAALGYELLPFQGVWSQLAKHYSGRVGPNFGIPDTTKRVYMLCFIIIVHKDNLSER